MKRRKFFKFFPALLVAPLAIIKAVASKDEYPSWIIKGEASVIRGRIEIIDDVQLRDSKGRDILSKMSHKDDAMSYAWWTQEATAVRKAKVDEVNILLEKARMYGDIISTPGRRTAATSIEATRAHMGIIKLMHYNQKT